MARTAGGDNRAVARRRLLVALLGVAALVVPATPALATAPRTAPAPAKVTLTPPPTPGPTRGHLLAIAPSASAMSSWSSSDLTALESSASVVGNVGVAEGPVGQVEVAGRTAAGHVVLFSSTSGVKGWTSSDVTSLASAPAAAGDPAVVVDGAGVTRIFFRTGTGQLEEVENDRHTAPDPWFSSDLSALTTSTLSPTITGNPTVLAAHGDPLQVFARAAGGALVSFTLTTIPLHPWFYEDVSGLAKAPQIVGVPVAVPAPDGFGLTAVYATSATGSLLEFTDDDADYRLWSVRDVSQALGLPTISSSPSALAGLPAKVAVVTTTGHLLVVTVPTVTLTGAIVRDVSAAVRQRLLEGATPSIAAGTGDAYAVAGESVAHHVEVFDVASPWPKAATTVSDATMQALTEQLALGFPVAADVGGATTVFVATAGFVGLTARIVLAARAEDQLHAAVVDTPSDTNCNPFTANFDRGTTQGCVPGTAAEEWCSDFADWVWTVSGVDTTGIDGASASFVTWGRSHHQFLQGINQHPAVGDAVVWGVLNPLWGSHVGIVVAVSGKQIDVVSGNSGGYAHTSGVWDSGWFVPSSQTAQGDPIIGYVSPVPLPASSASEAG